MRHIVDEDFFRRSMGNKGLKDSTQVRGFDTAGQLSVRKRTGAALTKLYVGFRIQASFRRHFFHVRSTFFHRTPALDKDRCSSCTGKRQRRE